MPYLVHVTLSDNIVSQNPEFVEVYDGDLMVGKARVTLSGDEAFVVAWEGSEKFGLSGFTAGNPIDVRVLSASGSQLVIDQKDQGTFGESFAARLSLEGRELPQAFSVDPAYPNPFNPSTTLNIHMPAANTVRVCCVQPDGSAGNGIQPYINSWDTQYFCRLYQCCDGIKWCLFPVCSEWRVNPI